jgi:hypothetical protein
MKMHMSIKDLEKAIGRPVPPVGDTVCLPSTGKCYTIKEVYTTGNDKTVTLER